MAPHPVLMLSGVWWEAVGRGWDRVVLGKAPGARRAHHTFPSPPSIDANPNGLFPPVEFPVPRGTPLISPHIKWDHSQVWDVPAAGDFPSGSSGSSTATVYNIGEQGLRGGSGWGKGAGGACLLPPGHWH